MKALLIFSVFIAVSGFGASAISQSTFENQSDSEFTNRRLSAMYKNFVGTYLQVKEPSPDFLSQGQTLVWIFVKDGELTAYTLSPFSTAPQKISFSLKSFHRDYQIFLDDAGLGQNAVGTLDSQAKTNEIAAVETRTGRFKRQVITKRITLDKSGLSLTYTVQNFKRFAFFGSWVPADTVYSGDLNATKIASMPLPTTELVKLGKVNPDAYSAETGQRIFSDDKVKKRTETGTVLLFKARSDKCPENLHPGDYAQE